jgi:hypothetical protein
MTVRQLPKTDWRSYCDRVSKAMLGKQAQLEVAALPLGDQIAAKWVPLIGITYDPKGDTFEVAVENLDHLIHRPRDVHVDEQATGLVSMAITDTDGRQQIVQLREPLMLSPPGT